MVQLGRLAEPFAPLRYPAFRVLWLGVTVSASGTWLRQLAASVLVFNQTGSAFMVGILNFAAFFPMLVFGLIGGQEVDRWGSRRILLSTQVVSIFVAAALALASVLDRAEPLLLIAAVSLQGVSYAFAKPAVQAALPEVVPPQALGGAISLNSLAFTLGMGGGPIVAALVLRSVGAGAAFALDAASYAVLAAAATTLPRVVGGRDDGTRHQPRWSQISDGLRFVLFDRVLRVVLVGMATSTVAIETIKTLMPAYMDRRFELEADAAGLFVGAFGIGSLLGTFMTPWVQGFERGVAVATALTALAVTGILFAFTTVTLLGLAVLVAMGVAFMVATVSMTEVFFRRVPPDLRGRALAIHSLSFLGTSPFAALASGALAERLGVSVAGSVTAAVALIGAAIFLRESGFDFQK